MYSPLDVRLLEARTVALVLSVTHLALVIKYSSYCSRDTHVWIDQALFDMDKHLEVSYSIDSFIIKIDIIDIITSFICKIGFTSCISELWNNASNSDFYSTRSFKWDIRLRLNICFFFLILYIYDILFNKHICLVEKKIVKH